MKGYWQIYTLNHSAIHEFILKEPLVHAHYIAVTNYVQSLKAFSGFLWVCNTYNNTFKDLVWIQCLTGEPIIQEVKPSFFSEFKVSSKFYDN